jgi:hypothetical protein
VWPRLFRLRAVSYGTPWNSTDQPDEANSEMGEPLHPGVLLWGSGTIKSPASPFRDTSGRWGRWRGEDSGKQEGGCFPHKCNQINVGEDGQDFLKKSHTFWLSVQTGRSICR